MRKISLRRGMTLAAVLIVGVLGVSTDDLCAQNPAARFSIDPCTIPDLGLEEDRGWIESNHGGRYFAVLTDLSANRGLSVADGIVGRKRGETILIGVDFRDRSDLRPDYPVAVRVSIDGGRGSFVRPAGTSYRCRAISFFWNRLNGTRLQPAIERIEYSVGSDVRLAGLLPDEKIPRRTQPLWAITERLRIDFGETNAALDRQHRDGKAEYPVRPEGPPPGALPSKRTPNPFRNLPLEGELFGPNLEVADLIVREPFRAYVAFRDPLETSDEISVFGSSKRDNGEVVTDRERIILRRLGSSAIFVGPLIVLRDGYPDSTTIAGQLMIGPILTVPGGLFNVQVERGAKSE